MYMTTKTRQCAWSYQKTFQEKRATNTTQETPTTNSIELQYNTIQQTTITTDSTTTKKKSCTRRSCRAAPCYLYTLRIVGHPAQRGLLRVSCARSLFFSVKGIDRLRIGVRARVLQRSFHRQNCKRVLKIKVEHSTFEGLSTITYS